VGSNPRHSNGRPDLDESREQSHRRVETGGGVLARSQRLIAARWLPKSCRPGLARSNRNRDGLVYPLLRVQEMHRMNAGHDGDAHPRGVTEDQPVEGAL